MKQSDSSPWYKQFWPWFLITIPLISIILSVTMLNLALNTEDSLVIDDYYKEGKAINMELSKVQEARVRNIKTELFVIDDKISLTFLTGAPESGEALELHFYHATLEKNDFTILLTRDAKGIYRATAPNVIAGKWNITLSPVDESWKIINEIVYPKSTTTSFNP
ncbi:MAG: FixH family protein [Aliiglaciecola sp.]|uniref:FixH family protein n=1 Tax=Aliiglaciecola sp. M165 TaxID=2593649 RepID=UPI00117F1B0C|nr:FixH family protein [Aliiglaciecola sp. M165]TRY30112.1 FixH family protein [Aliiglaciecola sp. M165]